MNLTWVRRKYGKTWKSVLPKMARGGALRVSAIPGALRVGAQKARQK